MENYQKISTSKSHSFQEKKENRLFVQAGGKINTYVSTGLNILNEKKQVLEIIGVGKGITKAISVAEIMKRKLIDPQQRTDIFNQEETDIWDPILKGLDPINVTRHTPAIRIRLGTASQSFDE